MQKYLLQWCGVVGISLNRNETKRTIQNQGPSVGISLNRNKTEGTMQNQGPPVNKTTMRLKELYITKDSVVEISLNRNETEKTIQNRGQCRANLSQQE